MSILAVSHRGLWVSDPSRALACGRDGLGVCDGASGRGSAFATDPDGARFELADGDAA